MTVSQQQAAARREQENQTMQLFVELIIAMKSIDVPKWIELDLTASQLRAIFFLAFRGPQTVSDLARLLGLGSPAASILVQQLVEQSLVERSEDARDRRRTLVRLSERGADLMRDRRDQREARFRAWLARLTDAEIAGLLDGLSPLVRAMREGQETPALDLAGLL